jgi:hypothetical protein
MTVTKRRHERGSPLVKALRATKETTWSTINQDREAGCEDTSSHSFPPFRTETKMPQKIEDLPIDIVGFF